EFAPIGATNGYEVMMDALDPSLVDLELDLYWAVKAGQDPIAMFNRWPGRFQMCHLKDGGPAPERRMTEVGSGTINFDAILSQAKKAGFKHWFIEHDEPSEDLASVIKSSSYLSKLAPGGKAVVDTLP
ncbi:MAG: sugar phosphate isomerase/epimerase family protein, partial [Gemmatimonas sp.]